MKYLAFIVVSSLILFTACTDEIDIDLNSSSPQVVIEGAVTNQPGPYYIKISETVNFSDANNFPPIMGATVSIADNNGANEVLTETQPGLYASSTLVGTPGNTYTLTVAYNGKTYTSTSTMPTPVVLDSLEATESIFSPPGQTLSNYFITPKYTDPAALGNYYRFVQYVKNQKDNSIVVFNDNVNNGTVNTRPIISQDFDIVLGDTVTVEMQNIDKGIYDYFFSLASVAGNGPGGGTTPSNPVSNITGGALGYFSAHTKQQVSIIVE